MSSLGRLWLLAGILLIDVFPHDTAQPLALIEWRHRIGTARAQPVVSADRGNSGTPRLRIDGIHNRLQRAGNLAINLRVGIEQLLEGGLSLQVHSRGFFAGASRE